MLAAQDMAPDFILPSTRGGPVTLSALRPAPVVLFFYPRDNTSGCTRESQQFSSLLPEFRAAGAQVFGISRDDLKSHSRFIEKQDLTVPLLSDAQSDACERFGVWAEKKMYGKTFMGIVRSTFLIDGTGRIARAWPKVRVDGHAAEVLDAVKAL